MNAALSTLPADMPAAAAAASPRVAVGASGLTLGRVLRYWGIAVLMATLMTLFTAFQTQVQMLLNADVEEKASYFGMLLWTGVIWYVWALLSPLAIIEALRYPVEKGRHPLKALALQVVFAACFIGLHTLVAAAVMHLAPERFYLPKYYGLSVLRLFASQAHWCLMSYIGLVALVHVGIHVARARAHALAREEMRTQAVSAQLMALTRQMQPHFLFNALNALVSMQPEGSPAQTFTIRLADMLRLLLHGGEHATATLGDELRLVRAYLDIERARLGSRLRVDIDVDPALESVPLPSFILQPLVENAITHSIARTPAGGEIRLQAWREGGDVTIAVTNTCDPALESDSGDGMQLAIPNCRQRLALAFGPGARFDADFVGRNLFRASIILPGDTPALAGTG